jgi:tetratricopeptide (TPR) repeat protein
MSEVARARAGRTLGVTRVAMIAACVVVLSACRRPEREHTASSDPAPSITASASASSPGAIPSAHADPLEGQRRLALTAPIGGDRVDAQLVADQTAAARESAGPAAWIAVGGDWARKARESFDPGYFLNADAAATIALAGAPNDPRALGLRTMVLLNGHRFEEARALASEALKSSPNDPALYGSLSDALLELGRVEEAESATEKMLDLKPNAPSYARASYLRWLRGDAKGALESIRLAIDASRASGPTADVEPRAWCLIEAATIFWKQGDVAGAAAGARQALEVVADYPPALVLSARVALAENRPKDAVELAAKAYGRSRLVETAWLLGDARAAAGDAKGAEEAYAEVERVGQLTDHRSLGSFLATKNRSPADAARAIALLEGEKKLRGDYQTEDAYAWALHRAGRESEAKAAIDRARKWGTRDARLLYHAGAIHLANGDAQSGIAWIEEALSLCPEFDRTGAAEARALLATAAPARKAK